MSLAVRVALAIASLSILTAVVVTGSAILSTSTGVRGDVDDFLEERAIEIVEGTRRGPDRGDRDDDLIDLDDAEDLAEAVEVEIDVPGAFELDAQVQTLDGDGNVSATTGLAIPISVAARELVDRNDPAVFEDAEIGGTTYRVVTVHLPGDGAVQVATSIDDTTSLLDQLRNRLLVIGAALAVIAAGIGFWMAKRTLRPLRELTATAEHVARTQDLTTPLTVGDADDEIGRLATSFNEMLEALSSSREQQHRLVHDAAHELRTPLTSVNANIDLLLHAPDIEQDERQEILTRVRGELREMRTLFTELIELATDRQQQPVHGTVDLMAVVEKAVADLARRADNPVTIEGSSTVGTGDFKALHRAVTNLLGNAVKYSPPESPITITVQGGVLSVEDRGPGIPEADRERIFDRFHRLDEARPLPGSGLGLAIVAKVVTDHGGSTFVEDATPGPGAVIGFALPGFVSS